MDEKFLLAASIAAAFGISSSLVQASDGTITVSGSVNAGTCVIGGAGADQTVALPSIGTTALAAVADTAGATPFSIALTGCGILKSVHAHFEPSDKTNDQGRLKPKFKLLSGASGIELEILNGDGSLIKLNEASDAQNSKSVISGVDGSATMKYIARYYRSGTLKASNVNASLQYSVAYD
ncbi:fimbrial protein [Jeongeupia sp. USM3]|uniref:fimbrial protein n=1 Tax=Jeongeupia sp. USM3 TaxID=1906741 RepID=UPI00089DF9BF|nr:fimbrial protein [Jeongeupia sp. USM3]AOY02229.1 hypothetical protein BJP62_05930 [Jeongeupia sp. USM3]